MFRYERFPLISSLCRRSSPKNTQNPARCLVLGFEADIGGWQRNINDQEAGERRAGELEGWRTGLGWYDKAGGLMIEG